MTTAGFADRVAAAAGSAVRRTEVLDGGAVGTVRRVDLAYLAWTDTVGEGFLNRYRERRELGDGWAGRRRVYEVVPLLEHLRVLGGRYPGDLRATLSDLGY
ncbi:hypothetical protein [Halorarum salinum]|uniref:Uncharacterized protein n=1 Tax=Halorarum salinum TaxID=2743089 RepID=A0A7D5Q926_9EURY|nr:hypothetical protein [Halobaculum salinum]QLG61456.1 hypothetical protein HUG12_06790 [Halobaculum salinum]